MKKLKPKQYQNESAPIRNKNNVDDIIYLTDKQCN